MRTALALSGFVTALLGLASTAPLLAPRQYMLDPEYVPAAEPPYDTGVKADFVWAEGANTSLCMRTDLRWQLTIPTPLLNPNISFGFSLYNGTDTYDHPYNQLIGLGGTIKEDAIGAKPDNRTEVGNSTILQWRTHGYQPCCTRNDDPTYDIYGTWPLPKNQTTYYLRFRLYAESGRVPFLSETTWTPPAECIARWGNKKFQTTAERYITDGSVAFAAPSSAVIALSLLASLMAAYHVL